MVRSDKRRDYNERSRRGEDGVPKEGNDSDQILGV